MWQLPSNAVFEVPTDAWRDDEASKRLFGIELNNHKTPFEAACAVFKTDTNKALWASQNWPTDPIVVGAKSAYNPVETVKLLDKEGLALKLLTFADEKDPTGRFYISEAKDRLKALELYAKVQGFTDKVEVSPNANVNNFIKLLFVKPDNENHKEETIIEHINVPTEEIKPLNVNLKLVSAG